MKYFNINYEFDRDQVHRRIADQVRCGSSGYICVADGVILNMVNRKRAYRHVVDGSMFSLCDSSFVPLYIKWIYGIKYRQYCGSQIFEDIVRSRKYRMAFLGTSQRILDGLRQHLRALNPDVDDMLFHELPFLDASQFDYPAIAKMVEDDGADIIWVALGAPKQEYFMWHLNRHLSHGVQIAVGAAFKFFSGEAVSRAPKWMVEHHLEFVHRLFHEPKKQMKRCSWIVGTLPLLLIKEQKRKRRALKAKSKQLRN